MMIAIVGEDAAEAPCPRCGRKLVEHWSEDGRSTRVLHEKPWCDAFEALAAAMVEEQGAELCQGRLLSVCEHGTARASC